MLAIINSDYKKTKLLIENKASINFPDSNGVTPIMCAVRMVSTLPYKAKLQGSTPTVVRVAGATDFGWGQVQNYKVAPWASPSICSIINLRALDTVYAYDIDGKARWAHPSTSHHIKPEPLGEGLMW